MRFWKLALALGFVALIAAVAGFANTEIKEKNRNGNLNLNLVPPIFLTARAESAYETLSAFPENDAGISAYLHPVANINLSKVKSAFTTIDVEKDDYLIGTISVNDRTESEYPYVYVSSDGWIISYIPRDYKSEALISPFGYNSPTTGLAEAIKKVCGVIGVACDPKQVGYYHFKYPNANGMVVALEGVNGYADDEFFVYIPTNITLYNISWAYYSYNAYKQYDYTGKNWAALNGNIFVSGGALPYKAYGYFSESDLKRDVANIINVHSDFNGANWNNYQPNWVKLGFTVVYKE